MFPIERTLKVYGFYYYSIVIGLYYNLGVIYYIINNKFPPFSLFIFSLTVKFKYYNFTILSFCHILFI